jgi:hypothetical protein
MRSATSSRSALFLSYSHYWLLSLIMLLTELDICPVGNKSWPLRRDSFVYDLGATSWHICNNKDHFIDVMPTDDPVLIGDNKTDCIHVYGTVVIYDMS